MFNFLSTAIDSAVGAFDDFADNPLDIEYGEIRIDEESTLPEKQEKCE